MHAIWNVWHAISFWVQTHTITFTIGMAIATSGISLYAREIRLFLSIPPQRLSSWRFRYRLKGLERRLKALQSYEACPEILRSVFYARILHVFMVLFAGIPPAVLLITSIVFPKPGFHALGQLSALWAVSLAAYGIGCLRTYLREVLDTLCISETKALLAQRIAAIEEALILSRQKQTLRTGVGE